MSYHPESVGEQPANKSYLEFGLYPMIGDRVSVIRLIGKDRPGVASRYLDARSLHASGTIIAHVEDTGMELVAHDGTDDVGAYSFFELTPLDADGILSRFPELG